MKIHYRNKKHEKLVGDTKKLKRTYGDRNAREILWTIGELESADHLSDIPEFINPHCLCSNRVKLVFSLDVEHPNRLLFAPHWDYNNNDPLYSIKEIEIVELSVNTHDKKFNVNDYNR